MCRGSRDEFVVEEDADLGELVAVTVGHDGRGSCPSWHLDKVQVASLPTSSDASGASAVHASSVTGPLRTFPCDGWLDERLGDGATERRLLPGRCESAACAAPV